MHHWHLLQCTGEAPPGRSNAFTCIINNRLFVLGGYNDSGCCTAAGGEGQNAADMYSLDLHNTHWSAVTYRGQAPLAASVTSFSTKLWSDVRQGGGQEFILSFGGGSEFFRNPIHILDPRTMRWVKNDPTWLHASYPSYAGEMSAGSDGGWDLTHGPIVFGAEDGVFSNSISALDVRTWKWIHIHSRGTVPTPRYGHATFLHEEAVHEEAVHEEAVHEEAVHEEAVHEEAGGKQGARDCVPHSLYIFGGFDGSYRNDLYSFSLKTLTFRQHGISSSSTGNGTESSNNNNLLLRKRSASQILVESTPTTLPEEEEGVGCVVVTAYGGTMLGGAVLSDIHTIKIPRPSPSSSYDWEPHRSNLEVKRCGHSVSTWRPGMRPATFLEERPLIRFLSFGGHDGSRFTNDVYTAMALAE